MRACSPPLYWFTGNTTREPLVFEVDSSPPGSRVVRVLDAIAEKRDSYPAHMVIDNDPIFALGFVRKRD